MPHTFVGLVSDLVNPHRVFLFCFLFYFLYVSSKVSRHVEVSDSFSDSAEFSLNWQLYEPVCGALCPCLPGLRSQVPLQAPLTGAAATLGFWVLLCIRLPCLLAQVSTSPASSQPRAREPAVQPESCPPWPWETMGGSYPSTQAVIERTPLKTLPWTGHPATGPPRRMGYRVECSDLWLYLVTFNLSS